MFVVGVYVTSRYKNYEEFKAIIEEALKKYIPIGKPNAFCTGSSKSNNAGNGLVRRYAFEIGVSCRVFETQWANHIPSKPGKKNTAGVRANAMIVKNSNACIMFYTPTSIAKWDFMSGGCYNFQKMCGKIRRELIPIKVDIYKPIEKSSMEKTDTVAGGEDNIGSIGVGMRASDIAPSSKPPSDMPSISDTPSVGGGTPSLGGGMPPLPHGSNIAELPVDITGDGIPDTTISAIDTNGDGMPDSQFSPVDTDSNGTIDSIELSPLPDVTQQSAQSNDTNVAPMPTQNAVDNTVQTPATTTAAPQMTSSQPPPPTSTDDENGGSSAEI